MNQTDIDTFLMEQRAQHQAHLDEVAAGRISDIVPPPTFEQWLAAMVLEQRDVLRELWDKIVEYDMNSEMEEAAQDIDRRAGHTGMSVHQEWAEVLGIIEAVKLAYGEDMPIRAFK